MGFIVQSGAPTLSIAYSLGTEALFLRSWQVLSCTFLYMRRQRSQDTVLEVCYEIFIEPFDVRLGDQAKDWKAKVKDGHRLLLDTSGFQAVVFNMMQDSAKHLVPKLSTSVCRINRTGTLMRCMPNPSCPRLQMLIGTSLH
jgi:hypothetical protein